MRRSFRAASRLTCAALGLAALTASATAQDLLGEQARLAAFVRQHPLDYDATYRYVLLSTELKDYEAAIGALERLLTYNPSLSRAQKELGFLYARLGAYQTAALHLRAALAAGDLDPVQTAQIDAFLPDIEKQTLTSRWSGRLQVGIRSQSNASFFPANGLFLVGGVGVFAPLQRRSDFNSFQLAEIANDTDLDAQGNDQFETRLRAYSTQQFRLDQYNVALFNLSAGPRFALAPELWPGASIKPYITGATSLLGGSNYFNAAGTGVSLRFPFSDEISIEPGLEWRHLFVNNSGFFPSLATIASGDAVTGYVGGYFRPIEDVRLETRVAFTRVNAILPSQSFDQIDGQALLRVDFDPPVPLIGRKWTVAPYARIFQIQFDYPDPVVDPWRARRDVAWTTGVIFEAPVTGQFGFSGAVEYARNGSNLPNFSTNNLSVWFGPVARF